MAAEEVLQLFDFYWFEHVIFTSKPTISSSVLQLHEEPEKSKLSRTPTLIVSSFSDQILSSKDGLSPRNGNIYTWQQQQYLYSTEAVVAKNGKQMARGSIATVSDSSKSVRVAKLQTILSGKEVGEFSEPAPTKEGVKIGIKDGETDRRIRRKKKGNSKSLSELEFEELKGFIDLGFVFSDEDTEKSSLVSIVPGLQRLRRKACDDHDQADIAIDESAMSRPYLSEAWECFDKKSRKVKDPLMNWRIPAVGNEMELKDHLRFWAHTVASTTLMADEEVFKLFDFYWFEHDLFAAKQVLSPPKMLQPFEQIHDKVANLQGRSLSDRYLMYDDTSPDPNNSSPKSVIATPKLQKILSGKEICDSSNEEVLEKEENKAAVKRRRRRKRKGVSRSLSELEFEELKGFMDLGFVFTEEDKNSSLVSMIPGLQRWGEKGGGEEKSDEYYSVTLRDQNSNIACGPGLLSSDCDSKISRPYLSEAWEVLDQSMATRQLIKWKFPALHNESNMKNHLKAWAHTVASMIKY